MTQLHIWFRRYVWEIYDNILFLRGSLSLLLTIIALHVAIVPVTYNKKRIKRIQTYSFISFSTLTEMSTTAAIV